MAELRPFFENVRETYDIPTDYFSAFLGPTLMYSCGLFQRQDMTLEEAQLAKIDMALEKLGVQPGQRVLDLGCGWGTASRRAAEEFGVNVISLTLSEVQRQFVLDSLRERPLDNGSVEPRVQGWEEFHEPVDHILSLEVFEHIRKERYAAHFERRLKLLPADGRMYLQSSLAYDWFTLKKRGLEVAEEHVAFAKFIRKYIFPGGQLCEPKVVVEHAEQAGFRVIEQIGFAPYYPRTLQEWAGNLEANRAEAIAAGSEELYERYRKYLLGCKQLFEEGRVDCLGFLMTPAGA